MDIWLSHKYIYQSLFFSFFFLNMKHTTIATHRLDSITILEHLLVRNIQKERGKKKIIIHMELMTLWLLGGQHHSVMYKNSVITRRETSMKILSCIVVTCIISVHHIIRKWTYYFQLHKTNNNLHRHVICIRCLSERLDSRIQNFSDFIYIAIEILTLDLQQNTVRDDCGGSFFFYLDYESREERRGKKDIL